MFAGYREAAVGNEPASVPRTARCQDSVYQTVDACYSSTSIK